MRTTRTNRLGALAACSLLVAAAARNAQAGNLTFEERVAAQEAIEQVYWGHRIWPEANPKSKPPLEAVLSASALRAKVARALRLSTAVEAAGRHRLTGAELQQEIARMVAETKAPDTLRELFTALHDDPVLIAECLARPAVVARLAAAAGIQAAGPELDATEPDAAAIEPPAEGYTVPAILGGGCTNESWAVSSLANGGGVRVPAPRQLHTSVWTGSELIVWGGSDGGNSAFDDGGVYEPATDAWLPSALAGQSGANAPSARYRHTAVWTGTEMIVWGGRTASGTALDNGGRYDPTADVWSPSSLEAATGANVPSARQFHTAVWTGTQMIVWGGSPNTPANALKTGGVFDAATDGWTASALTNGTGAFTPAARTEHSVVWAGAEMIIWGGRGTDGSDLDNGGLYVPSTDAWLSSLLTTGGGTNLPSPRHFHTAVWTGTDMIIWGGTSSGIGSLNTGGRYRMAEDAWVPSSLTNGGGTRVPTARQLHTAIWTDFEMIVWGGSTDGGAGTLNTGGRYNAATDSWAVSSLTNGTGARVPTSRQNHTAVWTGASEQMIVWGGSSGTPTGGLFCASCLVTWYADADADGFGDPGVTQSSCLQPSGYVLQAGDCDDSSFAIHPGVAEACDGLDGDCDTVVDNGGDALCADADACSADVCRGTGGCAAPPATTNLDVTGFSASRVDGRDLVVLADAWNSCPGDARYDAAANLDQGTSSPANCVDLSDFHLFMNSFGRVCP